MAGSKRILLGLVVANLIMVVSFPPCDYVHIERRDLPTFDGFHPAFAIPPNRILNGDFLALEIIVVLSNLFIGWLLLGSPQRLPTRRASRGQQAVLWLVAINLVVAVLFPPFENIHAISRAILPSFDGFYFVFGDHARRQIVTTILYIEIFLILANGLIFWFLLGDRSHRRPTAEEVRQAAGQIRTAQQKRT